MVRDASFPTHVRSGAGALGLAVAVSLGACGGSTPNPSGAAPSLTTDDARYLPDLINLDEIVRLGTTDPSAFALIRRLRPTWLLARGRTSFTIPGSAYPVVYVDDIRRGGLMTLHQIAPNQIRRMEFIGRADATTRWGTGHLSGVINIVTGR